MKPVVSLILFALLGATGQALAAGLSPGLYHRLNDIREQMDAGKHKESLPRLHTLLKESRGDNYAEAVVRQHLGYGYLETDQLPEARRELSTALELDTLPPDVGRQLRQLLAQIVIRLDKPKEALRYLQAWLSATESPTPDQRVMAAQIFYSANRAKQAIDHLEQAVVDQRPVQEAWQRSLLGMYLETKRYKKARQLLHNLIRQHPRNTEYWRHLAGLELQTGRSNRALEVLALAHEQGLLEVSELTRFARLHAALGIPEKAARLLGEWRESGRLRVTANRLRTEANLCMMARERQAALKLFEQAARLSKNGRDDYERGRILFDTGRWQESSQALQLALERGAQAEAPNAQLLLGIAAYRNGNLKRAQKALRSAADHVTTRKQAEAWLSSLGPKAGD